MHDEPVLTKSEPLSIDEVYERGYQAALSAVLRQLESLQQTVYHARVMAPERHALNHACEKIKWLQQH